MGNKSNLTDIERSIIQSEFTGSGVRYTIAIGTKGYDATQEVMYRYINYNWPTHAEIGEYAKIFANPRFKVRLNKNTKVI